jgi:type 1 glutamine amidotransferase
MLKKLAASCALVLLGASVLGAQTTPTAPQSQPAPQAGALKRKILFFTKSSGFEHSVIAWKDGQPSWAERTLSELGARHNWEFTFSKDGSKIGKAYLAQFDAVFFYTTGDLLSRGTDGQPPMTPEGKQALFDYVRAGRGFIGTHSTTDTFHTNNESKKGPDRYVNHGEEADPFVRFLGGEFIRHGDQQSAKNTVVNPKFPGFEKAGAEFTLREEWYSLKDFAPDIHVLTVIDSPAMKGHDYARPPYPTTWARREGAGRVWYTAMGHREDVWTNPLFQDILVGGIKWALGEAQAETAPNIQQVAPGAYTNQPYPEPKAPSPQRLVRSVGTCVQVLARRLISENSSSGNIMA